MSKNYTPKHRDYSIKQIRLSFHEKHYKDIVSRLTTIAKENKLKNHTEVFMLLLENYENERNTTYKEIA